MFRLSKKNSKVLFPTFSRYFISPVSSSALGFFCFISLLISHIKLGASSQIMPITAPKIFGLVQKYIKVIKPKIVLKYINL